MASWKSVLRPSRSPILPQSRGGDGRGEQVRRGDPGDVVQAAEVADDVRQRGGHDGLVERGQQHAEHQAGQDHQHLAVGELRYAITSGVRARHRGVGAGGGHAEVLGAGR